MDGKEIEIMSQWFDLCYTTKIDLESATTMGKEIADAYSSPQRSYHTLEHISHCFSVLDRVPVAIEKETELRFAIWFNDFIYDPKSESNEDESATIAYQWLKNLKVCNSKHVRNLILSTANYLKPVKGQLSYQVLHDIDLAILASEQDFYLEYQRGIREEYEHLPDEQFFLGRGQFLHSLLKLTPIFAIQAFEHQWEEKARQNISNELKKIEKVVNLVPPIEK